MNHYEQRGKCMNIYYQLQSYEEIRKFTLLDVILLVLNHWESCFHMPSHLS